MKWTLTFFLFLSMRAAGQTIDYWHHFRDKPKPQLRIGYDNDFFASTDRYYSQGISAAYVRPVTRPGRLFFPLAGSQKQFGISADHMAFTPSSIAFDSLLANDHPYAATIRANAFFESIDTLRQRTLGWSASLGFIGPEMMGKEMQTAIHKALENPRPNGWQHQLNTGLVLNAGIHAEQRLFGFGKWLQFSAEGTANAGTMHTDLTTGARLQFRLQTRSEVFSILLYANPAVRFVGYDGTLQGSLVAQHSEYRISAAQLAHVVFEREFGAEGRIGPFTLTGIFQLQSPQYKAGMTHRWGGLRVAFTL